MLQCMMGLLWWYRPYLLIEQGKINDRGVAAVAYNVLLRPGVTLGVGASFDTQKLDQATHKVGTSFTFES